MAFPRNLLGQDEELILELRPHWIALVRPAIVAIVLIIAMILGAAYVPGSWPASGWIKFAIVVIGILLIATRPVRVFVAWFTSLFVVTSDRVIHRSGWLAKRSMEIPLENITDVHFSQTVFERLIGAGDLTLESPGEYGQDHFSHVQNPQRVQKVIYELTEENRKRLAPVTPIVPAPAPSSGASQSVADELTKLARLRQQGILTEEEFQAQKARLLRSS